MKGVLVAKVVIREGRKNVEAYRVKGVAGQRMGRNHLKDRDEITKMARKVQT